MFQKFAMLQSSSDRVSLYDPVIQKLELDPAVATNIKRYNLSV
jgi:hypothetical protein